MEEGWTGAHIYIRSFMNLITFGCFAHWFTLNMFFFFFYKEMQQIMKRTENIRKLYGFKTSYNYILTHITIEIAIQFVN